MRLFWLRLLRLVPALSIEQNECFSQLRGFDKIALAFYLHCLSIVLRGLWLLLPKYSLEFAAKLTMACENKLIASNYPPCPIRHTFNE